MIGKIYKMWHFADCEVSEQDFDHSLHCFYIETDDSTWKVVPNSIEEMNDSIQQLDNGQSPIGGWEDGFGNTVG